MSAFTTDSDLNHKLGVLAKDFEDRLKVFETFPNWFDNIAEMTQYNIELNRLNVRWDGKVGKNHVYYAPYSFYGIKLDDWIKNHEQYREDAKAWIAKHMAEHNLNPADLVRFDESSIPPPLRPEYENKGRVVRRMKSKTNRIKSV